jgi:hypothetical protein
MAKNLLGVLLVVTISLVGCGTVSFDSTPYKAPVRTAKPVFVGEKPTVKVGVVPAVLAPKVEPTAPVVSTYHYGRFTVEVKDGKQRVIGGQFMPSKAPPLPATKKHVIYVDYQSKELMYYIREGRGYKPVVGYAVVTPSPNELPQAVVRGVVKKIDTNPSWCPTKSARKLYPQLPPGCLPPGHVDNTMGAVKFVIDWEVPNFAEIRLHGTSGYPEGNFYDFGTLGCTRLEDAAILDLVKLLGKDSTREGIEVVLMKGDQGSNLLSDDSLMKLIKIMN